MGGAGDEAGDAELTRTLPTFVKQGLRACEYPRVIDHGNGLPKMGSGKIDGQALKRGG